LLWQRDVDKFRREFFSRVWPLLNGLRWSDPGYDVDKAYVCAVFAKLAYLNIPEFELAAAPSAKLVPCLTYQRLLLQRGRLDFPGLARSLELAEPCIHVSPYVVITGVARPDVIFLAIRGTRILHATDVLIDLDFRRIAATLDQTAMKFHRGFYLELTKNLQPVTQGLLKFGAPDVPVYVVGHSLGGAMAAILFAIGGRTFNSYYAFETLGTPNLAAHASFTYGMPRYGNGDALTLRSPFHLYNARDVVPTVPPRVTGFANAVAEYRLEEGRRKVSYGPRPPAGLGSLVSRVWWARGIRHHFIERYIRRLA
jgi:hypothetical protein